MDYHLYVTNKVFSNKVINTVINKINKQYQIQNIILYKTNFRNFNSVIVIKILDIIITKIIDTVTNQINKNIVVINFCFVDLNKIIKINEVLTIKENNYPKNLNK